MNISKSDIQGHYYYITSQTICQAPRKKTPDRSRAFSPKGVKQESHTVQGKPPRNCALRGGMAKKYWRLPNSYDSKYIIPHIRRNVKRWYKMLCVKCKKDIPDGAPFCCWCGKRQAAEPRKTRKSVDISRYWFALGARCRRFESCRPDVSNALKSLILHGFRAFFIRLDSAKIRVKSPVFSS